jgi:hypothetical protein
MFLFHLQHGANGPHSERAFGLEAAVGGERYARTAQF